MTRRTGYERWSRLQGLIFFDWKKKYIGAAPIADSKFI